MAKQAGQQRGVLTIEMMSFVRYHRRQENHRAYGMTSIHVSSPSPNQRELFQNKSYYQHLRTSNVFIIFYPKILIEFISWVSFSKLNKL